MASSAAGALLGLVLTLFLTRGLGASGAGAFFVAMAVFTVCTAVFTFGADLGAMRMTASQLALGETQSIRPTIVAGVVPVAVLSSAVALVLYLAASAFAPHLIRGPSSDIVSLLRAVIPFLPFATVYGVMIAATRGFGAMTPFVVTEVGRPLLSTIAVGLALGVAGTSVSLAGVAWAAPCVLALVYATFALRKLVAGLRVTERIRDRASVWREFWRFASLRGVAAIFQVLVRYLDVILVAAISSARDAGIYAAISRLALVGMLTQRAVIRVTGPRFSALFAVGNHAQAQSLYGTTTSWLISLSFPFYTLLAVFSPVVVLIFGSDFEAGAIPLTILSIAMLVNVATGPSTTILLMSGRASWNLANSIGAFVLNTALNVALIPTFGITGAAIAWAVSVLFQNLLPTWQIYRAFDLHPISAGAVAASCAALLVYGLGGGLVAAVWGPSALGAAVVAIGLTAIYLALLWHFRELLAVGSLRESVRLRTRERIAV